MRRCSAPSQLTAKRPRFTPPEASATDKQERSVRDILQLIANKRPLSDVDGSEDQEPRAKLRPEIEGKQTNSSQHLSFDLELDLEGSQNENSQNSNNVLQSGAFVPSQGFPAKLQSHQNTVGSGEGGSHTRQSSQPSTVSSGYRSPSTNSQAKILQMKNGDEPQKNYYNVMWCKNSARKHKKWEGDAILITSGRSVKLLDLDGKEIGQGTGYKTTELQALVDGSTLVIGGKMIEVMNPLAEEQYLSGKCFQGSAAETPVPNLPKPKLVVHKPFVRPMKSTALLERAAAAGPVQCDKPMFNPDAAGALVMPRPSQAHQWEHNGKHLPVVDVVVDPHISRHLRPHQREGIIFLYQCVIGMRNYSGLGAILADEMGLGKTLQCIALLWTLYKQGPYGGKPVIRKAIIITPGSLVKNWAKEFKKWLGSERIQVYAVAPDKKVEEFVKMTTYPVLIISYEMFVRSIDLLATVNFDLVVCDEGHRLKNSNIKTTSCVSSLNVKRRVVLTGTPVQNDLQELYSLVDFCNPGILGTLSAFQNVYEKPITAGRDTGASLTQRSLGEKRATELNRITSLFILRRTQDINQKYLPPKVEVVLFCQPSKLQQQIYKKLLESRMFRSCIVYGTESGQHLICISGLKKLCNHPVLIYTKAIQSEQESAHSGDDEQQLYRGLAELYPPSFNPTLPSIADSGKFVVLASLLRSMYDASPRQRVVLVSNYTQTLYLFEELCKHEGYSFLRLDGQTPTAKRQALVERFNSPYSQDFVFLLSSKAGGVGLNLIGASRLILYDIDWNPANDLQAMARVWRDGQRQKVYVYRLLTTGSVEEKMYQRQVSKTGLSGVVVDAKMDTKLHFSPADLKDIFSMQENTLCATHDLLQCGCGGDPCWDVDKIEDPNDAPISRSCQLQPVGATKSKTSNKVSMSELMDWKHVAGPGPDLHSVDPVLSNEDLQAVTYTFWNEMHAVS